MIDKKRQKKRKGLKGLRASHTKLSDEVCVRIKANGDAVFYDITGYSPIRKFNLTKEELDALSQEIHGLLDQVDKLT